MKKTLYIHIGMHKTGTTALQNFFALNRSILMRKGILYPGALFAHHKVGWDIRNTPDVRDLITGGSYTRKIFEEIQQSDAPVVLLSSETFVESKTAAVKMKKIIDGLLGDSVAVKIIFYCRRQDHSLQSAYQQKIQPCSQTPLKVPIGEFLKDTNYLLEWDYYQKLHRWSEVFGKDAIIVKVYEKNQFYKNDLIRDFLHIFGLELTEDFQMPSEKQSNIGLGPDATELLRIVNLAIEDKDTKKFLMNAVQKIDPKIAFEPYSLLSPAEKLQLLARYSDSNEKVAREYLGREDGKLFYEPLPNPEDPWKPYEGLTIEKIVPIFVSMMYDLDKKYSLLKKEQVPVQKKPVSPQKEPPAQTGESAPGIPPDTEKKAG